MLKEMFAAMRDNKHGIAGAVIGPDGVVHLSVD